MDEVVHPSVIEIWNSFIIFNKDYGFTPRPDSWYFCDNEKDANECANLVACNVKRATSTSLWWFDKNNATLPKPGDLLIVTNWDGLARAIIKTIKVTKVAFKDISETYAETEGEGDRSLEYWKEVHWEYYSREMAPYGEVPTIDMIIICEEFEVIWTSDMNIKIKV